MKRFSEAEAGDLVYCRLKGAGFITYTNIKNDEIRVRFQPGANVYYDCTGRKNSTDTEPLLFYRSSTDNYLTERPEPEVDWDNMHKYTLLEGINKQQEVSATFLTTSQQNDRVWILTQGEARMAYLVPASEWKPKAKEASCQKA